MQLWVSRLPEHTDTSGHSQRLDYLEASPTVVRPARDLLSHRLVLTSPMARGSLSEKRARPPSPAAPRFWDQRQRSLRLGRMVGTGVPKGTLRTFEAQTWARCAPGHVPIWEIVHERARQTTVRGGLVSRAYRRVIDSLAKGRLVTRCAGEAASTARRGSWRVCLAGLRAALWPPSRVSRL